VHVDGGGIKNLAAINTRHGCSATHHVLHSFRLFDGISAQITRKCDHQHNKHTQSDPNTELFADVSKTVFFDVVWVATSSQQCFTAHAAAGKSIEAAVDLESGRNRNRVRVPGNTSCSAAALAAAGACICQGVLQLNILF
jgi:hypothetical protein